MSVRSLPTPIRKLVLDPLPLSMFFLWTSWATRSPEYSKEKMTALQEGLAQLQDLTIYVDQSGDILPDELGSFDGAIESFEQFLKSMPQLRSLSITFSKINEVSAAFARTLLESKWARLENLIVSRAPCNWEKLSAFLLRHKGTLKKQGVYEQMILSPMPIDDSGVLDWEEVLTKIRDDLSLESFNLRLSPSDIELYHLSTCYDGTETPDHVWERLPHDQQHGHKFNGAALMERFVTRKISWPMLNPAICWTCHG